MSRNHTRKDLQWYGKRGGASVWVRTEDRVNDFSFNTSLTKEGGSRFRS